MSVRGYAGCQTWPSVPTKSSGARWLPVTHHTELLPHAVVMGARPVDPVAARALRELLLRREHVRWDLVGHLRFEHGDDWCVTHGASGEECGEWINLTCENHLPKLLAEVVAGDDEDAQIANRAHDTLISGQDYSALAAGLSDQAAPCQLRAVDGILPDQAEPSGEATQHLVYGKSVSDHHVPAIKIRGI